MALDRRITIQRNTGARDAYGEFRNDWQDLTGVWAQQSGAGSVDAEGESGVLILASRNYTIRYRSDLLSTEINILRVVDANGNIWNIESIVESDSRKRFIQIETVREA